MYASLKDKHAFAHQYVSIPTKYNVQGIRMDSMVLTFVRYSEEKIKIGDLTRNRFIIVVRDLKERELADITRSVYMIVSSDVPNYFDSQRFGCVIDRVFVGKKVVLKDYEKAVKQYLTAYQKSESRRIKDEKRRILSSWNDRTSVQVYNKTFNLIIQ